MRTEANRQGQPQPAIGWDRGGSLRPRFVAAALAIAVLVTGVACAGCMRAFQSDPIVATVLAGGLVAACMCCLAGPMIAGTPWWIGALAAAIGLVAGTAHAQALAALDRGVPPSWWTAFGPTLVAAGTVRFAWSRARSVAGRSDPAEERPDGGDRPPIPFDPERSRKRAARATSSSRYRRALRAVPRDQR